VTAAASAPSVVLAPAFGDGLGMGLEDEAVSNIEVGIEGLPAKRAYAWADVLELPRDAFVRFVTGEAGRVDVPKAATRPEGGDRLTAAEGGLIATYRKLPPKYQRRLREQAEEFETLARASRAKKG